MGAFQKLAQLNESIMNCCTLTIALPPIRAAQLCVVVGRCALRESNGCAGGVERCGMLESRLTS